MTRRKLAGLPLACGSEILLERFGACIPAYPVSATTRRLSSISDGNISSHADASSSDPARDASTTGASTPADRDTNSWRNEQRIFSSSGVQAEWGVKKSPSRPYLGGRPLVKFPVKCEPVGRRSSHRDIMRALARFNVQADQIRAELNGHFLPVAFWVNLPSEELQQQVVSGGPYPLGPRIMKVTAHSTAQWRHATWHPFASGSRDRFVLITGIQENATMADVARHLGSYRQMANAITFLREQPAPRLDSEPRGIVRARHRALVRLSSPDEAARAVRDLTNTFLLNNLIRLRTVA